MARGKLLFGVTPSRKQQSAADLSGPVRVTLHEDPQLLVSRGLRAILEAHSDRVTLVDLHRFLLGLEEADLLLLDPEPAPGTWVSPRLYYGLGAQIVLYSWLPPARLSDIAAMPGVVGHVPTSASAEELVGALEALGQARKLRETSSAELSDREAQVLALIARGLSNGEVADRLFLSINTVKTYIRSAYAKIGVDSRAQATAWTLRHYRP